MQAFRTRAAVAARRARPSTLSSTRSYASGHDHAKPHNVEEKNTLALLFIPLVPAVIIATQYLSEPARDGEPNRLAKWMSDKFDYFNDWEARNTLRTQVIEQAAHDKHLFYNAGKSQHVELKTPELFHSGSPWAVPAGHYINLDHVTEHYRAQAAAEEERKAKKLALKKEP
ncbi:hypothetical protein GGR57DRAFT_457332 [Xylariaceae sp. FL1272]|nr:hypothetical protein GGR57DRAFT_457332 [Xylariaceae sp. FL1272]